ncbi:3-ketoacyl-CoA synthase 2-like [Impatiens glandulifera]|uniref:3-ketoacyl-CoA synthase 2-like n=1 Tax=Impatiens glandulifera TaxID=253017 RepID=UPI001FB0B169|nr:3-ketoacyl-CoA synthase 2-like [Impatiens glandulifera]
MDEKSFIWASLFLSLISITIILGWIVTRKPSVKVYLLDFACHKPPSSQTISKAESLARARLRWKTLKPETLDFFITTIERCGLGDSTYVPKGFLEEPMDVSLAAARREIEQVIFGAVDTLLTKTKIKCEDIGILVVNCCIFDPIPSLSSMIVNHYKLKDDIRSYSLSGMGCSASLRAIDLAKQLLQVHPNSNALVVSTEGLTQQSYTGNDRSKFIINSLFRVGGAAMLLSNRLPNRHDCMPKYELIQSVHTHMAGSSDSSYRCIYMEEDEEGETGVSIGKDLLGVGAKAIRSNITSLARLILPIGEKLRYMSGFSSEPDMKRAFEHFLPHVGGKPLLDELQKSLGISDEGMEPSRMTLHRYGNVSSSSVWYEFAYAEAKGRVKKGDRVWQIAFGAGFKCSSIVWRALRSVSADDDDDMFMNPWKDEIESFPVETKSMGSFAFYLRPSDEFVDE